MIIHGIPDGTTLNKGDIISIDVGAHLKGITPMQLEHLPLARFRISTKAYLSYRGSFNRGPPG